MPSEKMKVLFVTSEMTPLLTTGGLAEVAQALPRALQREGCDVRIVMPCYAAIPQAHHGQPYCMCVAEMGSKTEHGQLRVSTAPDSDIPLYLIEHEGYFGRKYPYGAGAYEYPDNAERFCFFSLALLHAIPQTGWVPDIIHCHDWHASPIPTFLRTRYAYDPIWGKTPVLFTIHNLAFQGRYDAEKYANTGLSRELFHPEALEYRGDMNLMKGAVAFSTKLSTVSPRYSREIQTLEYGCGLDGMLKSRSADLCGILNGVDYSLWSPATDPHLPANYTLKDMAGKKTCKQALQKAFGLPEEEDTPLFGIVSRLYWQKGLDLLAQAMEKLADESLQVVVLGTGDPSVEQQLAELGRRYPNKYGVRIEFDRALSHLVQGGSDFCVMPSRYEPCGLSQLYAMAYGTIPIVRRTGGLADSVRDMNAVHNRQGNATGIVFVPQTPAALARAMRRGLELYETPENFAAVQRTGMQEDFSWKRSCKAYLDLYKEAMQAV